VAVIYTQNEKEDSSVTNPRFGARHPLSPKIKLGLHHPREKQMTRKNILHITHTNIGSRFTMSIAGVPFDSCQELNSHLTTVHHLYAFSNSREGLRYGGLTNENQNQRQHDAWARRVC